MSVNKIDWHGLASHGFSIFPLKPRDKRPQIAWERFQKECPTAGELAKWSANENLNCAIVTGVVSGVLVLDTDSDEAEAEVRRRGMPRTPTVRTAKGRHRYLRHPGGEVKNRAGLLPGADLRGDGGYVVAAGSTHPSGHPYEWEVSPLDAPFAEAPQWLIDIINPKESPAKPDAPEFSRGGNAYAEAALDKELAGLRRAAEGTRNAALNRAAFSLSQFVAAGCWTEEYVTGLLLSTAIAIGLGEGEALATIKSGMSAGMKEPRDAKAGNGAGAPDFTRCNKGIIHRDSQHNIRVALQQLGVRVRHDFFCDRSQITGLAGSGPLLDERAMERLWLLIDQRFSFRPSKEFFWTVVSVAARCDGFHPVRDYLALLKWDGEPRLDSWLIRHGGADDTPFARAVSAITLIAAVRRVRQPGCKFDEMLVLESAQGTQKSSAISTLAVRNGWFSDELPLNADGKRVIEALSGRWIVEAAELRGMKRSDVEHVKALLSRQTDRARLSYDRLTTEAPRQCIFIGTTNSNRYLRDSTGHRRFWPVSVKQFDIKALRNERDQLWAEAAAREAAGESIRLDPKLYDQAREAQEERRVDDPYLATLDAALGDQTGHITCADAFEILGVPSGTRTQDHNVRFGDAMRELGWIRKKLRVNKHPTGVYVKGDQQPRLFVHRNYHGGVSVSTKAPLGEGEL